MRHSSIHWSTPIIAIGSGLLLSLTGCESLNEVFNDDSEAKESVTEAQPGSTAALPMQDPTNVRPQAQNADRPYPLVAKSDIPTDMDATEQKIRQIRMGDVAFTIVDANGQPIPNATIQLTQTRHHFPFGVALSTDIFSINGEANEPDRTQYMRLAQTLFNAAVHENALKWLENEPKAGQVSYADADAIWDWSHQNQMPMRGHTLFWEVEKFNQDWVKQLSPKQLRQAMRDRVSNVCSRFKGRINEFDVFNEVLHGDFYRKRLGDQIFADMFKACHDINPNVRLYTNDFAILEGEKVSNYVQQIQGLQQQGAPIGGIGIQAHFDVQDNPSPERIEQTLDRLAQFHLPIKITELSIQAPDEQAQATKLRDFLRTTFAHPAVEGVMLWGFWEGNHCFKPASLYRQDWSEKPAGKAYRSLVFGQWWTQETLQTDPSGHGQTRAFYGNYTATIRQGDRQQVISFVITPQDKMGKTVRVKLD
jgi:endo-1,4-beta-xylanase